MATHTQGEAAQYHGSAKHTRDNIAIVVSRYSGHITEKLYEGCVAALQQHGVTKIEKVYVPGAFELPLAARHLASLRTFDAIICFGCIIKGETQHNVYISQAVADALMSVSLKHNLPVIFGVLTPENEGQALERAGGAHGNKGTECGYAALEMIDLMRDYTEEFSIG